MQFYAGYINCSVFYQIASNVTVPPDIDDTGTSSDVTVEEGDNVTLSCSASGHPEPRILWRREDGDHIILQDNPHDIKKGNYWNCF